MVLALVCGLLGAPLRSETAPHGMTASSDAGPSLEEGFELSIEPLGEVDHTLCFGSHCPNIIMVLSDDHGYTDLGKARRRSIRTLTRHIWTAWSERACGLRLGTPLRHSACHLALDF